MLGLCCEIYFHKKRVWIIHQQMDCCPAQSNLISSSPDNVLTDWHSSSHDKQGGQLFTRINHNKEKGWQFWIRNGPKQIKIPKSQVLIFLWTIGVATLNLSPTKTCHVLPLQTSSNPFNTSNSSPVRFSSQEKRPLPLLERQRAVKRPWNLHFSRTVVKFPMS